MKLNDMTKGALLCLGIMVLMAIAGTCDYQDAIHFQRIYQEEQVAPVDTTESAYDVIRYVQDIEHKKPQ